MRRANLAIVWHQHQPFYLDPVRNVFAMPWVRLHGVRDYYGMAKLLEAHPDCPVTINLVPSLVLQLERYLDGSATDRVLELARRPAGDLADDERREILAFFFHAHRDRMIRPLPRYMELLAKRGAEEAFAEADLRDLQLLFHLAWTHPLARQAWPQVAALEAKGRGFTEDDKAVLFAAHDEILAQVIPLHKRLAEEGTVELITSPFYHPILPLLCRAESTHEAMPGAPLPRKKTDMPEDAERQVQKALAFFESRFGARPKGMWPSEGSVSQEILPILRKQGVRWIASDEEVLYRSASENGAPLERTSVYETDEGVAVLFRDHRLSDKIGFHYHNMPTDDAVDEFIGQVLRAAETSGEEEPLVSVILDGENAWEHYPNAGIDFLGKLYERIAKEERIRPTRVSDHLERHPPTRKLTRLFAGSWIDHNFAIWIGHAEDRKAWDYLGQVRRFLVEQADGHPRADDAWEALYAAEGSDWFWWYGDDHFSGMDDEFDRLFRQHLKNVYQLLDAEVPAFLEDPIAAAGRQAAYTLPAAFMAKAAVDGRISNYFEWLPAGHYSRAREAGSMTQQSPGPVAGIYFGFDAETLYVRIDPLDRAEIFASNETSVRLVFVAPREIRLTLESIASGPVLSVVRAKSGPVARHGCQAAADEIVEVAIPFRTLGAKPGKPISFFVEVVHGTELLDKLPAGAPIEFECPSEEFDRIMWSV